MNRLWNTVAFRLAMGYGALVVGAVAVISAVLYFGTVGVLDRGINAKLSSVSERLTNHFDTRGIVGLQQEIEKLLTDGIDQDTEVYLLLKPDGQRIVGNLSGWTGGKSPPNRLTDQMVTRDGRMSISRLLPRELSNGSRLVVGRDMQDIHEIEQLVLRALLVGGAIAVLLAIGGAVLFRLQLERRIAAIRRTVLEIEAGDLSRRIPVSDADDEFTRLNRDLNHMLDQIQRLMDGVRDVSHAIAHDLRTPLGRIRNLLEEALRPGTTREKLSNRASAAIQGIDELIVVFDGCSKLQRRKPVPDANLFSPLRSKKLLRTWSSSMMRPQKPRAFGWPSRLRTNQLRSATKISWPVRRRTSSTTRSSTPVAVPQCRCEQRKTETRSRLLFRTTDQAFHLANDQKSLRDSIASIGVGAFRETVWDSL